jgi:hypothetical protein
LKKYRDDGFSLFVATGRAGQAIPGYVKKGGQRDCSQNPEAINGKFRSRNSPFPV